MVAVMAFTLCACNLRHGIGFDNNIAEQEIIRLIADTVNNPDNLSDSYSEIPEKQQSGVSYSYFKAYTDIIRRLSKGNGTITSFRILSDDEKDLLLSSYITDSSLDSSYWDKYGNIDIAELIYTKVEHDPVYVVVDVDSNGVASLSNSWISDTINIYNYAEHYFDMLDEQNVDGVFTLIKPGYESIGYSDEVIYSKAEALVNYYLINVKSSTSLYQYNMLSPVAAGIRIPVTIDQFSDSVVEHNLVVRNSGEDIYVEDSIYEVFDTELLTISKNNNPLLRFGNSYYNEGVARIMGASPILDSFYQLENMGGSIGQRVVGYKGLNFVIDIVTSTDNSWYGKLIYIRISNPDYYVGPYIHVGMTVSELMEYYPFIDQMNNEIVIDDKESSVLINYETDDEGVITLIELAEIN